MHARRLALAVTSLAVVAAGAVAPAALAAPPPSDEDVDEVVVIGQTVPTSIATVEVDREIMVDTAVALKDVPGANVNANGPVTGIAQYRGMHGDRVSVVIDQLVALPAEPAERPAVTVVPLPQFPASERDLALLVPETVSAGELSAAIEKPESPATT